MNDLATLKNIAKKRHDNLQDRQTYYVELLEDHIKTQNEVIETFEQELSILTFALTQEKS